MRRRCTIAVALVAIGALSGVAAYEHAGSGTGDWREIGWPFPRDGWPAGRAFRCDVAACREEIEIYVRPKIGFAVFAPDQKQFAIPPENFFDPT